MCVHMQVDTHVWIRVDMGAYGAQKLALFFSMAVHLGEAESLLSPELSYSENLARQVASAS